MALSKVKPIENNSEWSLESLFNPPPCYNFLNYSGADLK